jgi:Lrp/AsnC family transcriptional regulator for asnA, asnC and gidA
MQEPIIRLDDVDRAIVEHLQRDGRLPYSRLGDAVGLSEAATRQRVRRLLHEGVIQVVAVTNPLKVGKKRVAMLGLRVDGPTGDVSDQLSAFPEVAYLVVTAGSFDLLAEVMVADDAELLNLTNRIRSLPGVATTETFVYLDLAKQTYAWGAR